MWQLCPLCNGAGDILANAGLSLARTTCPVCHGARIIAAPVPANAVAHPCPCCGAYHRPKELTPGTYTIGFDVGHTSLATNC